jgi:hypothetical protein
VARLQRFTRDVVVTGLPLASIRRLSRSRFLLFRSVLVPQCRLSLSQVLETAEAVDQGLARLSSSREARFTHLKPEWYGFDPIHIRPGMWRRAWREILCGEHAGDPRDGDSWLEAVRMLSFFPERQRLLGLETITPQAGRVLRAGGSVWLY